MLCYVMRLLSQEQFKQQFKKQSAPNVTLARQGGTWCLLLTGAHQHLAHERCSV